MGFEPLHLPPNLVPKPGHASRSSGEAVPGGSVPHLSAGLGICTCNKHTPQMNQEATGELPWKSHSSLGLSFPICKMRWLWEALPKDLGRLNHLGYN